jgi:hypothetical protein
MFVAMPSLSPGATQSPKDFASSCPISKVGARPSSIMFAMTFGILTAKLTESGNDNASNPTISTLPLQY